MLNANEILPVGIKDEVTDTDGPEERVLPGTNINMMFDPSGLPEQRRSLSNFTAGEIETELLERKHAFREFHDRVLKGIEIYAGSQYTPAEREKMIARGQTPLVMNYYRGSVKALMRYHTAKFPQFDVTPNEDGDERIANMFGFLLRRAWLLSKGKAQWRRAINWCVNGGLSFLVWGWMNDLDAGRGDLAFQQWPTQNCLPDPYSQDPLYDDTDLWLLYKYVTLDDAKKYFPMFRAELGRAIAIPDQHPKNYGNDGRPLFSYVTTRGVNFVRITQAFRKTDAPIYQIHTRFQSFEWMDDPYDDPRIVEMLRRGEVRIETERRKVWDTAMFGGNSLQLTPWTILETQFAPVVPLIYEDIGGYDETSAVQPYGEAHHVEEINRTLNKSISTVLFHAQQTSNPRYSYRMGSIQDLQNIRKEQSRDKLTAPGTGIAYSGDKGPEFHPPGPLNDAFFTLYSHLATFVREQAGEHLYLTSGADMQKTLGGYLAQLENAREKAGDVTDSIETSMSRLGQIGIELFQQYYRDRKKLKRLFDDTERKRLAKLERMASDQGDQREIEQMMKDSQSLLFGVDELIKDVSSGLYDVTVITNSYAPTQRWATYNMVLDAFKRGAVDAQMVRDFLPLENREEVEARLNMVNQMHSQIEALNRDLSQKNVLLRQMMLKIMNANIQVNTIQDKAKRAIAFEEYQNDLEKMMIEVEAQLKIEEAERKQTAETPGSNSD